MTPRWQLRRTLYAEYLRDLGMPLAQRHALLLAYKGDGPVPAHCPTCLARRDDTHAPCCIDKAGPVVHRLCGDCAADLTAGEAHSEFCAHARQAVAP